MMPKLWNDKPNLYGAYLRKAAENAAAHIRALDLEQFYGGDWDKWDEKEQRLRESAKNHMAVFLETEWGVKHGA